MSLSGRYPEHDTCENFNAIDVRELQRKNLLRPGLCFTSKWFRDGAPSGDILIKAQPDAIMLIYRVHPPAAPESKVVEQQVPIVWTKCRLGARRPWFKCLITADGKVCGRRVAKIYGPCHLFACRHCLGLVYESQREIPVDRAMRRAQKIKMRLGGSGDPFELFPLKPRRMHWRTYERLREQARAADDDAEGLLAQSMPGFKELLALSGIVDPPPPRRKRQRGRRDGAPKPPPAAGSPSTPSRPHRLDGP
jgi:hypothetical protein